MNWISILLLFFLSCFMTFVIVVGSRWADGHWPTIKQTIMAEFVFFITLAGIEILIFYSLGGVK